MSYWTHIVAVIKVETCITEKNVEEVVREKLKDAPKITGSEGNADIFVNALSGYNMSFGADCRQCNYKNTVKHDNKYGGFSCSSPDGFECPSGDYQTVVVITIVGDLRDRMIEQTRSEYKEFIKFIKNKCKFFILSRATNIRS